MFRIGLKFPCNGLNRVKKNTSSRLYLTARCYETRARIKSEPEGRICKDVKLMSRHSGLKYSTESQKREKARGGSGTVLTLGAVAIGTLGVLAYAKGNPDFRATLKGWVPATDKTIQIIFQEESTYFDFIRTFFESLKQTIISTLFGDPTEKKSGQIHQRKIDCMKIEDYIPPKPALEPLVAMKKDPINEPYSEIRLSKDKGEKIKVVAEKPPPAEDVPPELMPENLAELEILCAETASKAIAAYQKATCAIQNYNDDVIHVVQNADATIGSDFWDRLKDSTDKKKETLQSAEEYANQASCSLKKLSCLIDEPQFDAPAYVKTTARRNIKKIMEDVDNAKVKYQKEQRNGTVTERYWKQVKEARDNLNEELRILFPGVNIEDKKFTVDGEAFDLFVLHMYNKVTSFQNELEKLRTVTEAKIRASLKASGAEMNEKKLNSLVCLELAREKQILEKEFSKKMLKEKKKFDEEMRKQLKLQSQVHADHLREALCVKDKEAERRIKRVLSEQSEQDSLKHKAQLAAVIGRLRGLETAFKAHMEEGKGASNAQILWSACLALARAVKSAPPGADLDQAVRPLEPEIKAVFKAAPKEDPLVRAAILGIPESAAKRGVFPEDTLRERFLKVENVARQLAMVPEQGAALPVYLLSYLQNFLMIKATNRIPRNELEDEPVDIQSLNTYDLLHRARYWLDRGNFKMTLRYMNLLKGAPRSVARDWMNETKILLETQQAVETLLAYAGAMGLVFVGAADSKDSKVC